MRGLALTTALIALGASSAAFAQNDSGLYAGLGAGQVNVELDDVDTANGIQSAFDGDDAVFKVFAGWRFTPFLGIEVDYVDLGGPEDTIANSKVEANIAGIAPYLVATIPLGAFEVFAKIGYYFYDVEIAGQTVVTLDESGEDFAYGLGGGVTLFDHLHARLEYEIIDVSAVDDANVVWLSAAWRF
jgi:OOP family OmpA-OmpF porin